MGNFGQVMAIWVVSLLDGLASAPSSSVSYFEFHILSSFSV